MIKKLFILSLVLLGLSACERPSLDGLLDRWNDHDVAYVHTPDLAIALQEKSVIVMDVREWEEFSISHLPDADWAGYDSFDPDAVLNHFPDRSTPIVVYCSLGIRSEKIGQQLQDLGYTNIQNLYGGIIEWKNQGQEVFSLRAQPTDSVHTYSKYYSHWLTNGIGVYD